MHSKNNYQEIMKLDCIYCIVSVMLFLNIYFYLLQIIPKVGTCKLKGHIWKSILFIGHTVVQLSQNIQSKIAKTKPLFFLSDQRNVDFIMFTIKLGKQFSRITYSKNNNTNEFLNCISTICIICFIA